MISFLLILCAAGAVRHQYKKDCLSGLGLAFFLLVLLPDSIRVSLPDGLPNLTVHRALLATLFLYTLTSSTRFTPLRQVSFGSILLCMVFTNLISTLLSPFFLVSAKQYLYFLIEVVGTFWIVRTSIKSSEDARRLLNYVGKGIAVVALLAILERYLGLKVNSLIGQPDIDHERFYWLSSGSDITGTYPHRILLGLACALGALKYIQALILETFKSSKGILMLHAFVCLAALYFSLSRGPWLAFGVGFLGLMIMMPTKAIKWTPLFALVVVVVFAAKPGVWATIWGLSSATLDATTLKGSSYQWRFVVIQTALSEIGKAGLLNELFGFGGGSQIMNMSEFGKYEIEPGVWLPIASWDCEYAVILYNRGWLGLFLVVLLSGTAIIRVARLTNGAPNSATHSVLVFAFVGLLFFAVARTNVALYAPQLTYVEMLLLGSASVLLDKAKTADSQTAQINRRSGPLRRATGSGQSANA